MSVVTGAYGFQLKAPGSPLERVELAPLEPVDDQVVVEVAGCGVCHTDIGFAVGRQCAFPPITFPVCVM